jgi:hypothetical protein
VLAEICAGVECGKGGEGFGKGEEEASVDEGGYFCDEDLFGDGPPCVAE